MKPQILSGSAVFVFPGCGCGVVAPVFSFCLWPHGCSGGRVCFVRPGRCVCRWAAARPLAVRAASLRLGASDRSSARPRRRPWVLQPGRADRAAWLSETSVAFARSCLWWVETVIAIADANSVFLVQFSGAEVMVVSMVAVQGRAVVLLVSTSPRCRASCAKKFSLRGLMCA